MRVYTAGLQMWGGGRYTFSPSLSAVEVSLQWITLCLWTSLRFVILLHFEHYSSHGQRGRKMSSLENISQFQVN